MITRRGFVAGLLVTAAGLILPDPQLAEPPRRLWALDGGMLAVWRSALPIYSQADIAAAARLADAAGRIVALIEPAVDALYGLSAFAQPARGAIGMFAAQGDGHRYLAPYLDMRQAKLRRIKTPVPLLMTAA